MLVSSPTGTGKTLTGFLAIINELFIKARKNELENDISCVYISPLKALANDINRNLNEPLKEIYDLMALENITLPPIRVAVRSGDTTQADRQKMLKKPPHILITTPESLALALTAPKFKERFMKVRYVIIDEIHEISSSKRGTLLSLNLERLEEMSPHFVRIGLSATQAPLPTIANFLCGYDNGKPRNCNIVDVDLKKGLDLETLTPVEDLTTAGFEVANERMYDILAKLIEEHKTTLIFTNTRSATEHVAIRLKARGIDSLEAHHSSLGKEIRLGVEEKLKRGELRCVISSTSLELGIDIGSVDLVIQIGSPKSVSKGLQRIGRAGHSITKLSMGRFVVFSLDDLVECAVLTKAAYDRNIDRVNIPDGALDVLSQAVVGMSLEKTWDIDESFNLIRRSYPYRNLEMSTYMSVIEYLAGRVENNTIYSKIWYDEEQHAFGKKKSTRMIYFMNIGTIPDDSDYRVLDVSGRHLGQLSDKFVERMNSGDIFVLGARTYSFIRTRGNKVIVRDATGLKPTIPSWTGEMLPRSYDLGKLIGQFREYMKDHADDTDIMEWLKENYHLDDNGARSIISYIKAQMKFEIPTDTKLYVEGYRDEDLYSMVFLIPLGRRVNDALSRAYAQSIANTYETNTRVTVTDDGFMLTVDSAVPIKDVIKLITPQNFVDYVRRSIANTTVFKERFRQCATRSLMVLRRYKGHEVPIVMQQLRSDKVLRAIENIPDFPVVTETFREIMDDMMDVPAALNYVKDVISTGSYAARDYSNEPSPFSLSLILAGVSDVVLMEERAKLLKELQSRIVDRVYGTDYMDFKIKDPKVVERYYVSKVPPVTDLDSLLENSDHFPMTDLYRTRMNSPFPYAQNDIKDEIKTAIQTGKLWSVSVRGIFWINPERYGTFKALFARKDPINESEQTVLNACRNLTANEIEKETGMNEQDVKSNLTALETRFLVRRSTKRDTVSYIKVAEIPESTYSVEDLLFQVLNSLGPMTFDEISVRYPMDREILSTTLESMKPTGKIIEDYITPVFARQYMINGDLERILGMVSRDPYKLRMTRYTRKFSNIDEYFETLGFYTDQNSVAARIEHYTPDMMPTVNVVRGRFFKHRKTVMVREMAMALQKLRESPLEENEQKIMDFLSFGGVTMEALSRELNLDMRIVREYEKSLEHRVLAVEIDGVISKLWDKTTLTRNEAMKILLKYCGPLSQHEIMNAFWFHIQSGDLAGIETNIGKRGVYHGTLLNGEAGSIILPINDPVSAITGRLVSMNSGLDHTFFYHGDLTALLSMQSRSGVIWIDEISSESDENIENLFRYLEDMAVSNNQIVTITGLKDNYREILKKFKYRVTENAAVLGRENVHVMFEGELFSRAMNTYEQSMGGRKSTMESITEARLGIRDVSEAHVMGIKANDLDSYFQSDLLFNFSGPFNISSRGTMETISIYRTLRSMELDKTHMDILKSIMDFPKSEDEIMKNARGSYDRNAAALKALWNGAVICKDSSSKYRFVIEKFSKEEGAQFIIEKLLNTVGFIDEQLYTSLTGTDSIKEYSHIMKNLIKNGMCEIGLTADSMRVFYIKKEKKQSKKGHGGIVLSPRDLVYQIFKSHIKSVTGGTRNFVYVIDGEIRTFASSRRNRNELSMEFMESELKLRTEFIRALSACGYSVRTQ